LSETGTTAGAGRQATIGVRSFVLSDRRTLADLLAS
jgi:hypothetical protein